MMKESQPGSIFLKDYVPPAYLIDETQLQFDLYEDHALVTSTLTLRRNPEVSEANEALILNGVDLELVSLAVDGALLGPDDYLLAGENLTVSETPARFTLTCVTRIKPQDNTCLEGLYRSAKMFCTQCEAEGFRRITYYLDRPDVMSSFTTKITADKTRYPVLLSNGNETEAGDLPEGRHYVTWQDPFKKPSYLFALVAGDLHLQEDRFVTMKGREIALRMYVDSHNADKCDFAIESLKKSMTWDEEVYGREYDLDIFMIVAVDDFNMGAMENKGLNIFNSSCVLAKPEASTDAAFERIEGIVAHEYFHNWSGNRVTCRDWFQLSLKEGFTVFRDAEFSADMGSRDVKRIDDVNVLRTAQFAEDAGPMAHPVRPDSYIEISNFYTLTIYEKGAEVVRMIHTLLGPELFRKGSDLYFDRFDGMAVTTDDFVQTMEYVSGLDLTQFRRWYDQAGTPVLTVEEEYQAEAQTYTLRVKQHCPDSPGQTNKKPYHIPFAIGLLDEQGRDIPLISQADQTFACAGELTGDTATTVLNLKAEEELFTFTGVSAKPRASLLRGFSAPVRLQFPVDRNDLMFLMSHDSDGFNRWDAGQKLALDVIQELIAKQVQGLTVDASLVDTRLIEAYRNTITAGLKEDSQDKRAKALLAKMMMLPSEQYLTEVSPLAHVDAIHSARGLVLTTLAEALKPELRQLYVANEGGSAYQFTAPEVARRAVRNTALGWLLMIDDEQALEWALAQYSNATCMTDRIGALAALMESQFIPERDAMLSAFYDAWKQDAQVVESWFALQCSNSKTGTLARVQGLMSHPAFDVRNPNKLRAVIGSFVNQSLVNFHEKSGEGYAFLADRVIELDRQNPQIAARLVIPLTRWKKYDTERQVLMQSQLERILAVGNLSKDVYEIVSKGKNN